MSGPRRAKTLEQIVGTTGDKILEFTESRANHPQRKTKIWLVENKTNGSHLGEVRWQGAWRQYCFFPADDCVFEKNCLRRIADYCEARTIEHRKGIDQ